MNLFRGTRKGTSYDTKQFCSFAIFKLRKFLFTQRAAALFPFLGAFLAGGFLPMAAFTRARSTSLKLICVCYSLYAAAESTCVNFPGETCVRICFVRKMYEFPPAALYMVTNPRTSHGALGRG